MQLSESDKNKIKEILATKPGIRLAYLYGSYVTGLAREDSDVDIGLLWDLNTPVGGWKTEFDIALKLEETIGKNFDVRIINDAPIYFLDQVVNKGQLLYASSDKDRVEFEAKTIMNYLDYRPVFDLYNKYRDKRLESGEFGVKYRRNPNQNR
jgi:predicted nucleotidyltransferase